MRHTHRYNSQTLAHDHGVDEVHPDLTWQEHGYFGHVQDHPGHRFGRREIVPHVQITDTLDGFLETYAPGKAHITLGPMDNNDTRQVVNINLDDYPEGRLGPFIVVRSGKYAVVLTTMPRLNHLCVDAHAFVDGQKATVGVFGMTDGGRTQLASSDTTSHGWLSAAMVALLIGEQT